MSVPSPSSSAPAVQPFPEGYASQPAAAEDVVLAQWRSERTFETLLASRRDAEPFVFWEGPPTANGRPGIHHVLARTLKDMVCRYQTMLGKRVERKAGWDTHGLPVELEVEKQLGISGKPAIEGLPLDPSTGLSGVARFNDACRKSVWKYREEWERLSERIGYWLDYQHPYVTYEPQYIDSVWHVLAQMHSQGLVYRGKKVLPFCGRCGTGLSSHELGQPGVYKDLSDPSVYVRFRLRGANSAEGASLLAWTTTPWTLPSNIALAVHPEREYVKARVALPTAKGAAKGSAGYEVVWIVAARAASVLGEYEELARVRGRELEGWSYEPLFSHAAPEVDPGAWKPAPEAAYRVCLADYVTVEDGTGIVHQAPSYGADDWATAQRYRLPVLQAVGADGRFARDFGPVQAGVFFKDADDALMEDLKQRGLMFRKAREPHSYPHCWRCNTPLHYFAAPAWFVRTSSIKERMVELNRAIQWAPEEVGSKRFGEWLENNIDWNISRERYWGTPLPFWVCDDCGHETAVGSAAELERRCGKLPAGFDHHKPSVDEPRLSCERCGGQMRRTSAVLDCWFDSGAMPYAQHGWPHVAGSRAKLAEQFPASFICEGLDQTRGWFYTLHAIGAFMTGAQMLASAPELRAGPAYRTCLVNGLVLDKDGVKMSKRLGNIVDPWKALEAHGADALRWYLVASAAPWLPKRFDPQSLVDVQRGFFGTLTNSFRFFQEYARIDRFDPRDARIPALAERPLIDRWLASRTQSMLDEVRRRMDGYDLAGAARAVEGFVVDELSNWYIRRNRRRLWKGEQGPDKLAAFATLHEALRVVSLCIAPLAPFLAEMLWTRLAPGAGSVHAQLLPRPSEAQVEPQLEESMRLVQRVVVMGRALRERAQLKVRQPLRALHVRASDPSRLELLRSAFASELILDELNIKGWGSLAADDGQVAKLVGKANFRTLGKRLGALMKAAAAQIERLSGEALARLRAGESIRIEVEGESIELFPEDVLVQVQTTASFDVEADGQLIVWLDTQLDEELIAEGFAREAVNRLNAQRKALEFAVEQRIVLLLSSESAQLRAALERHAKLIAAETLATRLEVLEPSAFAARASDAVEFDLGAGLVLRAVLAPA
jgi:isoleucyl-tRNA synthetase